VIYDTCIAMKVLMYI